jgi:hypothetical protein
MTRLWTTSLMSLTTEGMRYAITAGISSTITQFTLQIGSF